MNDRCKRCNGQKTLCRCTNCGVVYRHIHKYSDCGSIGCDGEKSETIPCPDCSTVESPPPVAESVKQRPRRERMMEMLTDVKKCIGLTVKHACEIDGEMYFLFTDGSMLRLCADTWDDNESVGESPHPINKLMVGMPYRNYWKDDYVALGVCTSDEWDAATVRHREDEKAAKLAEIERLKKEVGVE